MRLIIIPQYPARLRYQEWWPDVLSKGYATRFQEVLCLLPDSTSQRLSTGSFSDPNAAIKFELDQIKLYMDLDIDPLKDVVLLCDLSFPGLFAQVLFHRDRRPARCYAVCHATSRNFLDYFSSVDESKWLTELGVSMLFDTIFVASEYHKKKLSEMTNTHVIRLPHPPWCSADTETAKWGRPFTVSSVARDHAQKVNLTFEKQFSDEVDLSIHRFKTDNLAGWWDYSLFLSQSQFLLVSSREETYGYQIVDALMHGVIPIAPAAYSYLELLPFENLYIPGDALDAARCLEKLLQNPVPPVPELWSDNFIEETSNIMMNGVPE